MKKSYLPKRGRPRKVTSKRSTGSRRQDMVKEALQSMTPLEKTVSKAVFGPAPKAKSNGVLSERQVAQHQKAVLAVARWTTRLVRAANEVAKHTKTVKRYERLTKHD